MQLLSRFYIIASIMLFAFLDAFSQSSVLSQIPMAAKSLTEWTPVKFAIHNSNRTTNSVEGRKAVFRFGSNAPISLSIIKLPESDEIWVGESSDYYFKIGKNVSGLQFVWPSVFLVKPAKCVIKSAPNLEQISQLVSAQILNTNIPSFDKVRVSTRIMDASFFQEQEGASNFGNATIQIESFNIEGDKILLMLNNLTRSINAKIVIDPVSVVITDCDRPNLQQPFRLNPTSN